MTNDFLIYMMMDPRKQNGRHLRYVGLTTNGAFRYAEHLTEPHNQELTNWVHDMRCNRVVPYFLVLEMASSAKELQLLEMAHIHAQRAFGEHLLNKAEGGTLHLRHSVNPNHIPYSVQEVLEYRTRIKECLVGPSNKALTVYEFLTDMAKEHGGYQPDIERYKALLAKYSVLGEESVLLQAPLPALVAPQEEKKGRGCTVEGCTRPHHGKGLCKPHHDKKRREGKKKPTQLTLLSSKEAS